MFIVPVARDARQLSRLFDDTFERLFGHAGSADTTGVRSPALDVVETERGYTVTLEMPGVAKEDVKVAIEGRQVNVQAAGERRSDGREERREGERLVYRERAAASYARSFTLPVELDAAEAGAKLENGLLTLTLPKRHARVASQITIN